MLLEELGAPYEMRVLNIKTGEQRQPAYLSINPMGKVPAIVHNGALVTEQVAVSSILRICLRRRVWRRRSAIPCAVRICAGWRFTALASSPPSLTGAQARARADEPDGVRRL